MAIATFDDAKTQYLANLDYQREASREKAQLLIEACDALTMLRPSQTSRSQAGGGNMGISFESLVEVRKLAVQWLAANPAATQRSARLADFSNFRDQR